MAIRGNLECNTFRDDFRSVGDTIFFFKIFEPPLFLQLLRELVTKREVTASVFDRRFYDYYETRARTEREDDVQLDFYFCTGILVEQITSWKDAIVQ